MPEIKIKKEIKEQNKIASDWLIYYHERKESHQAVLEEIQKKPETSFKAKSNIPQKPTEILALKLAEHSNNNTAKWLYVVECVTKILSPKKALLLKLRQECKFYASPGGGRPGWIAAVQYKMADLTGWCPNEQYLREMWLDIIHLAIRIAYLQNCKF
jgi:hypothetical protein